MEWSHLALLLDLRAQRLVEQDPANPTTAIARTSTNVNRMCARPGFHFRRR